MQRNFQSSRLTSPKTLAWASQRILDMPDRRLDAYHEKSMRGTEKVLENNALIPELLQRSYINLKLTSKTRTSAIRDCLASSHKQQY